jgi:predicted TIM-barrel fold metal-dependent hydrolase
LAIDLHTHYVPQELADELRKRKVPPFITTKEDGADIFRMPHGTIAFPPSFGDMDARQDFMAGLGIKHQVLSFPGLFGLDSIAAKESLPLLQIFNNEVAKLAKAHPETFSGLAALPMADMDLAVQEYKRARDELGLIGAILPNNCFVSEEHAQAIAPIFKAAQEIGGHIFIHPGRRPDEVPKTVEPKSPPFTDHAAERLALRVQDSVGHCMVTLLFSDFLDAYPDISLHVANMGGTLPMVIERMDNVSLTRTPDAPLPSSKANRVHVDCSSLGPRSLELAAAIFGTEKIVFGTDCPIFSTEQSLNAVAKANISDADKQLILTGNAEKLLVAYS